MAPHVDGLIPSELLDRELDAKIVRDRIEAAGVDQSSS